MKISALRFLSSALAIFAMILVAGVALSSFIAPSATAMESGFDIQQLEDINYYDDVENEMPLYPIYMYESCMEAGGVDPKSVELLHPATATRMHPNLPIQEFIACSWIFGPVNLEARVTGQHIAPLSTALYLPSTPAYPIQYKEGDTVAYGCLMSGRLNIFILAKTSDSEYVVVDIPRMQCAAIRNEVRDSIRLGQHLSVTNPPE
jgi:hypothetical protein